MRLRLSETPWGITRLIYAYLAALLAGIGSGIGVVVAAPLAELTMCADGTDMCQPVVLTWVVLIVFTGLLGLIGVVCFRLGWEWMAWIVLGCLLLLQLIVETNAVLAGSIVLLLPAIAVVLTWNDENPPGAPRPKPWTKRVRRIVGGVLLLQFIVWVVVFIVTA
ncbi:MAG: hypothetical protein LBM23_10900 [Propionibacteriaceae bacterium]|jgi:hypothetical protein|nr:hypothetical protein [Propionibacteriaceae bacterium]